MNETAQFQNRISRWANELARLGLPAAISFGHSSYSPGVRSPSAIRFLSGWTARTSASFLVVTAKGETLLVVPFSHDFQYARENFSFLDQIESCPTGQAPAVISEWLSARGIQAQDRVGLTGATDIPAPLNAAFSQQYELESVDLAMDQLRSIKDELALAQHRRAALCSDAMIERFYELVAEDGELTGDRVMAEVEHAARLAGSESASCWIGVGNDGWPAYRLEEVEGVAYPQNERAVIGTFVTWRGQWGHCLRTAFKSPGPYDEAQLTVLDLLHDHQATAVRRIRPGARAADVEDAAQAWIEQEPTATLAFGCFRSAHFMGLDYGEYPTGKAFPQTPGTYSVPQPANPPLDAVFEVGQVLQVHTNFYHDTFGLVIMGDMFVVTEEGAERLTQAPTEPPSARA